MSAVTHTHRPAGQPGTVSMGRGTRLDPWREVVHTGLTYPAVRDESTGTVRYWRDTESSTAAWLVAPPRMAESFEPGPEWQERCTHVHGVPWRTCDTEAQCDALARDDAGRWGR